MHLPNRVTGGPRRATTKRALWVTLFVCAACPAEVEHRPGTPTPRPEPQAGADDPRVHADGEDLYSADVVERAQEKQRDFADDPALGRGRPDESNGVCRLYAPKLPTPECCPTEFGFDVATVREACGLDVYMGESWQFSCGYYFHLPDGHDTWFRTAFVPGDTPEKAARKHAEDLTRRTKESFEAVPVEGLKDVWQVSRADLNWTFLPGWSGVRLLTWKDNACTQEGIGRVAKVMIDAEQPPKNARRNSLVPTAR